MRDIRVSWILGRIFGACCLVVALSEGRPIHAQSKPLLDTMQLTASGSYSFGHFNFFAGQKSSKLTFFAIDADMPTKRRHMNYILQFVPVALLDQPVTTDIYGDALTSERETNYGIALSPGIRFFSHKKRFTPYFYAMAGPIYFTKPALAKDATHFNLFIQSGFGAEKRINEMFALRSDFSYVHISNAFLGKSNPGLDELALSLGLTFHMRKPEAIMAAAPDGRPSKSGQ